MHANASHPEPVQDGSLPISETFASIQGEGKLSGVPSFFIRVSGCNLRCAWCDTPYASWAPESQSRPIDALVAEAQASGLRHAVLTGGEPMMFAGLTPLSRALRRAGMHITIETAGTIEREVACDLMSISPKLASSTPRDDPRDPDGVWTRRHEARRFDAGVLRALWGGPWPDRQLKFVFTGERDVPEIRSVLDAIGGVLPEDVLLMPEGVDVPSQEVRRALTELCARTGWRYCRRLHIELFGDTRGT